MDIVELAKRRGFFWPSSLIYSPLSGFFDYAHLGSAVKRRFENTWRDFFLSLDDYYYEIQPSLIMPEAVFKASGHLDHFVDPMVTCTRCGHNERADQLLEERLKESFDGLSTQELDTLIKKHKIVCSKCKGALQEVAVLNMTFPLKAGTGKEAKQAYLTPETAQGAYVNFKQMFEVTRKRLPMGLAIVGKAFRNEIAPRNALIRMREFTQAELQIFFNPAKIEEHPRFAEVANMKLRLLPFSSRTQVQETTAQDAVTKLKLPKFYVYHLAKIQEFFLNELGYPRDKFRLKELQGDEKAFYNKYHWDIELELSIGWKEVGGLHYRTDHDLSGHARVSQEKMEVTVEGEGKVLPHVLEVSMGVDRNVFALLDIYAREGERDWIALPRKLAPFDVAVFPLVNKDKLPEKAREIKAILEREGFSVVYDYSGSIGRMYRRIDEIGGPACITVDYDSLQKGDVTLRDRDTMKQIRVPITALADVLERFLNGEDLASLGR